LRIRITNQECTNVPNKQVESRPLLVWDVKQRMLVLAYRGFGTAYRSYLQDSTSSRRLPRNVHNQLPTYSV